MQKLEYKNESARLSGRKIIKYVQDHKFMFVLQWLIIRRKKG